jgi:hypothetical protein
MPQPRRLIAILPTRSAMGITPAWARPAIFCGNDQIQICNERCRFGDDLVDSVSLDGLRVEFSQNQPPTRTFHPAGGDFLERSEKSFYKSLLRTRFCPLRSSPLGRRPGNMIPPAKHRKNKG